MQFMEKGGAPLDFMPNCPGSDQSCSDAVTVPAQSHEWWSAFRRVAAMRPVRAHMIRLLPAARDLFNLWRANGWLAATYSE
jgi:hypothetical protein